jgi:hypothetical protein
MEPVDARETAGRALTATRPGEPLQVRFGWRLREADLRYRGRGVARMEPPYRIRLDLFTDRGETLFQAALVGGALRIPFWAPRELAPPPALLWAAVGVFRPDPDMELAGGRRAERGGMVLRYRKDTDTELRFRLENGRLARAELHRGGHLAEVVELSFRGSSEDLRETVYRNRREFRELVFEIEGVESVETFPTDIWYPGQGRDETGS